MTTITIKKGTYAKETVTDIQATMLSAPKHGKKGWFVTVDPSAFGFNDRATARVMLDSIEDVVMANGSPIAPQQGAEIIELETQEPVREETKAEAIERIRVRFETLDTMTHAVADGTVRGLIVSGPPGVGKSFGVEKILDVYESMHKMQITNEGKNAHLFNRTEIVKGSMTAIGLYQTLYNQRDKGDIIVFDDCDSILLDDVCLNMLKAALDSGKKRKISWKSESQALRREGIPTEFEFKAGVIFITNMDFENVSAKKLRPHLDALVSRCHYLDLDMHSTTDCFLRIEQIMQDGLLAEYNFGEAGEREVVDFMHENVNKLAEISLRMVLKLADLRQMTIESSHTEDGHWKVIAGMTCMKNKRVA